MKEKHIKSEDGDLSPKSELMSPTEGLLTPSDLDPSKLPDHDSTDSLSSLPSPTSPSDHGSSVNGEFTKLSVYSPTQDSRQFSLPEEIASEPQSDNTLPEKHYASLSESEFSGNSSEPSYYSSSARGYSFSQSSVSPNTLISPSTAYPVAGFNPTFSGAAEGGAMMVYQNAMSPTAYMNPYGTTAKQYTWPTPPNGYSSFGHDIMPSGYASYQPGYSQMTRASYPTTYFPPPANMPVTSSPTC